MKNIEVSVLGAGYVGLTTAALLAESGYKTYLVETKKTRLNTIRSGRSFFYEAGLDPIIKHALKTKKLIPTDSYQDSIHKSTFIFSCVGTPDNPDGSSNLSYVFTAAEEAAKTMKPGSVFIQKSTVPVGTGKKIEEVFKHHKKKIEYVSNPEFLREGTAISDSLWPDRVVVGSSNRASAEKVIELYKKIEDRGAEISTRAGIYPKTNHSSEYFITSRNSAELIKVTANAFLALKVSFANSIAKLSDQVGADITEVMDAVGSDKRIGRAFLNAGRGYGGGCFPKDVSGLISSAHEFGSDLHIMVAASDVNESMPGYIASKIKSKIGDLKDKRLAVLGLAFKAGTSDSRRSPGVRLANILSEEGARVKVYDPKANKEAEGDLRKGIAICQSTDKAVTETDAVLIATDWLEFTALDFNEIKKLMRGDLIVDCMNALDENLVKKANMRYMAVGRY